MSKKKKRHSSAPKTRSQSATLADEKIQDEKKFNPIARGLLFFDLAFLALMQILTNKEIISVTISNWGTIMGVILLLVALWLQFGRKNNDPTSRPR